MFKAVAALALSSVLVLSGCAGKPDVNEDNVYETVTSMEKNGYDIELCTDTLFWELYSEIKDMDGTEAFIALSVLCAEDAYEAGSPDAFNSDFQKRYDAVTAE